MGAAGPALDRGAFPVHARGRARAESRRPLARLLLGLDPCTDAFASQAKIRLHEIRKMDAMAGAEGK